MLIKRAVMRARLPLAAGCCGLVFDLVVAWVVQRVVALSSGHGEAINTLVPELDTIFNMVLEFPAVGTALVVIIDA